MYGTPVGTKNSNGMVGGLAIENAADVRDDGEAARTVYPVDADGVVAADIRTDQADRARTQSCR